MKASLKVGQLEIPLNLILVFHFYRILIPTNITSKIFFSFLRLIQFVYCDVLFTIFLFFIFIGLNVILFPSLINLFYFNLYILVLIKETIAFM